jgi:acyl dehydratase
VSFPAPVFIGDTLYFESTIDDKRLSSSRPGQGIITLTHRALNQDGVLVGETKRSTLVWCEGARP